MNETNLSQLVASYQPSADVVRIVRGTKILLLVGISGAGKDTIKHRLLDTGKYHHIVSHTTRSLRENAGVMEQDGVEYHFITPHTAENMLRNGEFVEAKEYSGNMYGTSTAELQWAQDTGKIATTDLEVQGVAEYKALSKDVIAVFILPPSYDEWQRRLSARYGSKGADPADMQKRMHTAITELEDALKQNYYHFVINEDINKAVESVDMIAHNHDKFNPVDDAIRLRAEQLLADLSSHL
ncbi:MAG: guanylate kinase [Candidatus Saccharimonadales bacterium]